MKSSVEESSSKSHILLNIVSNSRSRVSLWIICSSALLMIAMLKTSLALIMDFDMNYLPMSPLLFFFFTTPIHGYDCEKRERRMEWPLTALAF